MRYFVLLYAVSVCLLLCGCQEKSLSVQYQSGNFDAGNQNSFSYVRNLDLLYNEDFSLSYEQDLKLFYQKLQSLAEEKEQSEEADKLTGPQLCRAIEQLHQNQHSLITLRQ